MGVAICGNNFENLIFDCQDRHIKCTTSNYTIKVGLDTRITKGGKEEKREKKKEKRKKRKEKEKREKKRKEKRKQRKEKREKRKEKREKR
jgi:hypothetical protein